MGKVKQGQEAKETEGDGKARGVWERRQGKATREGEAGVQILVFSPDPVRLQRRAGAALHASHIRIAPPSSGRNSRTYLHFFFSYTCCEY